MERMLIVDDEIKILEWLEELFLYEYPREVEVHAVSSAYEALEILDQMAFHVILTYIRLWKDRNACQKIWSHCGNWGAGLHFRKKCFFFCCVWIQDGSMTLMMKAFWNSVEIY